MATLEAEPKEFGIEAPAPEFESIGVSTEDFRAKVRATLGEKGLGETLIQQSGTVDQGGVLNQEWVDNARRVLEGQIKGGYLSEDSKAKYVELVAFLEGR